MDKKPIRIELTEEQRRQIKEASGQEAEALEFNVEELELRIAPALNPGYNVTNF